MFIHAKNGNVFEVPDDQADSLTAQGHLAFATLAEAKKAKTPKPEGNTESAEPNAE